MSFIKNSAILASCALALSGCKERSCLEKSYDQVSAVVRGVNEQWCKVDFNENHAVFTCRDAILSGTVSDRVFDLTLKAPGIALSLNNVGLRGMCGNSSIEWQNPQNAKEIAKVQSDLRRILRDLEID